MKRVRYLTAALVLSFGFGSAARAQNFQRIPSEKLEQFGKLLAGIAKEQPDAPLKVDPDGSKAAGVHAEQKGGLMVIPTKDMEENVRNAATAAQGAPLGVLILYNVTVVADGKPVAPDRLRMLTVTNPENAGESRSVALLYLAARKNSEDSWTLLVYSKDKKPIAEAAFTMQESPDAQAPLDVDVADIQGDEGSIVITVMKKYQAKVRGAKQGA